MRLEFLGTGASGGTPGEGRSRRRESSLRLVGGGADVLVDATRDIDQQLPDTSSLDAVVLTHGHRDASGGIPALRWSRGRRDPLPVFAHVRTHQALRGRYRSLDHVELVDVPPGRTIRIGDLRALAVEVPHARSARFPTFAWRFATTRRAVVYASDVAELTDELEAFARGSDLLVLDGAMYGRSMFTHLRIEHAVPTVCGWAVGRVLLTQIGRTAPPHDELAQVVSRLCPRAAPAFDGLEIRLDGPW